MSVLAKLVPQFFPRGWEGEYGVLGIPFTDEVLLGFVTRGKGQDSYLLKSDCVVKPDQLLPSALTNLAAMKNNARMHIANPPAATVAWLEADDNFAAVRMLLPSVRSELEAALGEQYLFTIPSRDLCLFWTRSAPMELTAKHAREAEADYATDEYNLSPHVYVYSERWPCQRWRSAG
jgi:hypothetical protein